MRRVLALALLAALSFGSPAVAATAKQQKMDTCKVGADHEHLTGGKRKQFLARCMAPSDRPARRAKKPQPN